MTPRCSPETSPTLVSEVSTSSWMGESFTEVLSKPLDGAGLGERVRSVEVVSGGGSVSSECERRGRY